MSLLLLFVRSMGMRRGLRAWWRALELRTDARLAERSARNTPTVHHGERPNLPGWRR